MYEYPPSAWQTPRANEFLFEFCVVGLYVVAIIWILKKFQYLKQFSLLVITATSLLFGYLLSPSYVALGVLIGFGFAVFINHRHLKNDPDPFLAGKSTALFYLVFMGAVSCSLISTLLFPTPQVNRGKRPKCLNNMRNVVVAIQAYATDHSGHIPATAEGEPPRSWRVEILPYLERKALRDHYDDSMRWNAPENKNVAETDLYFYRCPDNPQTESDDGYPLTAYAAITGTKAMWNKKKSVSLYTLSQADGLSQTLMLVEACGQNIAWAEPRDVDLDTHQMGINLPGSKPGWSDGMMSSSHLGGTNVVFADGSARTLSEKADPIVLKKLSTATGGEPLLPSEF